MTLTQEQQNAINTHSNDTKDDLVKIRTNFINNKDTIDELNDYQNNLVNFNNLKDTYTYYNTENAALLANSDSNDSNIVTNYRKTYYEEQGISNLNYYDVFFYMYMFIFFSIMFSLFTSQSYFSVTTNLIIIAILIIYPYVSTIIFSYIMNLFSEVNNLFPTDIYSKL
jgi:hypothetical protein